MKKGGQQDFHSYADKFPKKVQLLLKKMRSTIKKAAPRAQEIFSYGMPAFKLNGILVWFAAYKGHIGFYPKRSAMRTFKKELSVYPHAVGAVRFPLDEPLPLALVSRIVKFRVKDDLNQAKRKASKKKRG